MPASLMPADKAGDKLDQKARASSYSNPQPSTSPFTTPEEAAEEVVRHNNCKKISEDQKLAIARLAFAVKNIHLDPKDVSDTARKLFADMDLVFFNGRLLNNVFVRCPTDEDSQAHRLGLSEHYAVTIRAPKKGGKIGIWLNVSKLEKCEYGTLFMQVWACLLHEMWWVNHLEWKM
ncbi:hypothetical protein ACLMJK_004908 [Lecanora helva]